MPYKVVRAKYSWKKYKYESAIAWGKSCVQYKVNRWAKTPDWLAKQGYYLTIFKNLKYARIFKEKIDNAGLIIFKCKVKKKIKKIPPMTDIKCNENIIVPLCYFPEGTIMAEQVMITEEVK